MKRIFEERAKLVVYVESVDIVRMTERARSEGKLLAEWLRETLLGELEDKSVLERGVIGNGSKPKAVRRPEPVGLGGGSAMPVESSAITVGEGACAHGAKLHDCKVWGCWQYQFSNGRGIRKSVG